MQTPRPVAAGRDPCAEVCLALCDLALGMPLDSEAGRDLAAHVRGCGACETFVDELAAVRGWLEAVRPPGGRLTGRADLAGQARRALAREAAARLSRDLLALSRGRPMRPTDERTRDLALLDALRRALKPAGGAPLVHADVLRAGAVLSGTLRPAKGEALRLAVRLDPLGLDVSLAWMGVLARAGEHGRASAVAERFLDEL